MTMEFLPYVLFAWAFLNIVALSIGRVCSSYFPCLISSKYYFIIKNQRLQNILIRRYLNRSLEEEVSKEDRNKLSMLGCIYYAVIIPFIIIGHISLICALIGYFLSIPSLDFFPNILIFIMRSMIPFMVVMGCLYKTDYYVGKRFKQD